MELVCEKVYNAEQDKKIYRQNLNISNSSKQLFSRLSFDVDKKMQTLFDNFNVSLITKFADYFSSTELIRFKYVISSQENDDIFFKKIMHTIYHILSKTISISKIEILKDIDNDNYLVIIWI